MKTYIHTGILALAFCLITGTSAKAQKFGHINSQLLLIEMPAVKDADAQIQVYQQSLLQKGDEMVKAFEAKYVAYADQVNKGELNKIQMQQKEGELTKEQQAIQAYEVEIQNLLVKKRETLYQPILDKVKSSIELVGKEGGYTMIFDTSGGAIVHAQDSEDILPLVKVKLGI